MAMTEREWLNTFGDNLVHILREQRMSQRELADESGLSESIVSDYINKRKMPGVRAVINMAYALNMEVDELINFEDRII